MAKATIHVGLEIGTSKVCAVVGEARPDGSARILGVGQAPSRGVRKGEIVDFETAQICLHDALVRAEDRSDVTIRSVYLAVSGSHIESLNNRGCIRIPEGQSEITVEDIDEVKEMAREVAIPQQNVFLHSIVRHYIVDGQDQVLNPVGMLGRRLEADYHIVHGIRTRIQNSIRCVREIPLEVEDVVFAPIAAAQVALTREQKDRGALLIDMGGGTTDYLLFADGAPAHSGSIPLGGDHVTNDLSIVLKIPLTRAEKLKVEEGSVDFENVRADDMVRIEDDSRYVGKEVERSMVNEVIHARVRETLEQIYRRLEHTGYLEKVGAGVFLTGGASLLGGVESLAESIFDSAVHRAATAPMSGLSATFENPQYAVPIGLIRYAQLVQAERPSGSAIGRLTKKLSGIFGASRMLLG